MLIPVLMIAAVLVGGWILALLIEAWSLSTRKSDSESESRPAVFNQKFSLWSFVLLLFAPSSSVKSSSASHYEASDSV